MKTLKASAKQIRRMKMALGYIQTGDLSLQVSHEFFHREIGVIYYEVGSKKTEGEAKQQGFGC